MDPGAEYEHDKLPAGPEVDLWAHAMREPLTSIRGFTQLALKAA